MPEAATFLKGFHLTRGEIFDGFTLISATSTHEPIKRYQEYRYEITLVFHNNGNGVYDDLYHDLMTEISQTHIIYGIKNPYRCQIDVPTSDDIIEEENGEFVFYLIGHSYRS